MSVPHTLLQEPCEISPSPPGKQAGKPPGVSSPASPPCPGPRGVVQPCSRTACLRVLCGEGVGATRHPSLCLLQIRAARTDLQGAATASLLPVQRQQRNRLAGPGAKTYKRDRVCGWTCDSRRGRGERGGGHTPSHPPPPARPLAGRAGSAAPRVPPGSRGGRRRLVQRPPDSRPSPRPAPSPPPALRPSRGGSAPLRGATSGRVCAGLSAAP